VNIRNGIPYNALLGRSFQYNLIQKVESKNGTKITNPTQTFGISSRPEIYTTFAYSSPCI